MPELPEVQTVVNQLAPQIKGKVFSLAKVKVDKMVEPKSFKAKIKSQKVKDVFRRAKIIVIDLDSDFFILVHLKMTGQLVYRDKQGRVAGGGHPINIKGLDVTKPNKFTHIILNFTDGSQLLFHDVRRFGWMKLVSSDNLLEISSKHGLEPLSRSFTLNKFKELLTRRPRQKIKQFLLAQDLIAGLGNIYVDESLFKAGIKPTRQVKSLAQAEIKKLHQAIKSILAKAIKLGGTSFNTFVGSDGGRGRFVEKLQVYGRAGQKCYKCRSILKKTVVASRGTVYCSKCQK